MSKPLIQTTGRRKRAIARVRVRNGTGKILVNKRDVVDYFPSETHRMILTEPLRVTNTNEVYDAWRDDRRSSSGQAGALRMGIARALVGLDGDLRARKLKQRLPPRDDREKESKKYGLKKARKALSIPSDKRSARAQRSNVTLKFGTDGVRGHADELTPAFVYALGRSAARVLGGKRSSSAWTPRIWARRRRR